MGQQKKSSEGVENSVNFLCSLAAVPRGAGKKLENSFLHTFRALDFRGFFACCGQPASYNSARPKGWTRKAESPEVAALGR